MNSARHRRPDDAPSGAATNAQTSPVPTGPVAMLLAVVALVTLVAVAGLTAMSWRNARLAEEAAGGVSRADQVSMLIEEPSSEAVGENFIHPGPILVPWRMVLVPSEAPEREIVVSGTARAPDGVLPGQELTMIIYHSEVDAVMAATLPAELDVPSPWLETLAGLPGTARVAKRIYYVVSGPDYEEAGFEVEFIRSSVVTGTM